MIWIIQLDYHMSTCCWGEVVARYAIRCAWYPNQNPELESAQGFAKTSKGPKSTFGKRFRNESSDSFRPHSLPPPSAMISDSIVAYIWVVSWATILHLVGPLCTLSCVLSVFLPIFTALPKFVKLWALAESGFYVWTILYQKHHLQRPAQHPARRSRDERGELFQRCQESTQDHARYIERWFLGNPLATIKSDNIKEFFHWAFFDSAVSEPEHEDEVDEYVMRLEEELGHKFEKGRSDVRCIRLTLDEVGALHRSLAWYGVSQNHPVPVNAWPVLLMVYWHSAFLSLTFSPMHTCPSTASNTTARQYGETSPSYRHDHTLSLSRIALQPQTYHIGTVLTPRRLKYRSCSSTASGSACILTWNS